MSEQSPKPWLKWTLLVFSAVSLVSLLLYGFMWWLFSTASVSTHGDVDLGQGNIAIPTVRRSDIAGHSNLTDSLIEVWAAKDYLDWQEEGKVQMPRILLAKLAMGHDVAAVNDYIQKAHVWGTVGSVGPFHSTGDYDFTLAGLCLILYSFGDSPELLYPETVDHILDVLMTESGGTPVEFTPALLGLPLRDTENHILMTEGSRYLKNRWLQLKGNADVSYDNQRNGLETFLLTHLAHMERAGFHEYNSRPYIGYTLTALLNLQSFADEPVSAAATRILDRANWEYALGSSQFRRFPPFRRQPRRAQDTDLDGDYHSAMIKAWMSLGDPQLNLVATDIRTGDQQALWVPFTSYRLPQVTADWILEKPQEYLVLMGHGADGSPEVYSGGPHYLITAGGVAKDRFKQAVARPTTLLLNDEKLELSEVLHITGEGSDYRDWNNTGVFERFAVGKKLVIPEDWRPLITIDDWSLHQQAGVTIATYASSEMGLFFVFPQGSGTAASFRNLVDKNSDVSLLQSQVFLPAGKSIEYDLDAPLDQWVITATPLDEEIDRNFDLWPLLAGFIAGRR